MKKTLAIILSVAMLLGAASVVYAATNTNKTYQDVKTSNWAYDAINTMSTKGVVKGYPDGNFKPQNTLTMGNLLRWH